MSGRIRPCPLFLGAFLPWLAFVSVGAAGDAQFAPPRMLSNREMGLSLAATNGLTYRIDVCTNFTSWVSLVSFPVPAGGMQCTDSSAPWALTRFYVARQLTNSGLVTGDHLPTAAGDVVIHPVSHASLALGWNNKVIYVDPAANSYAGLPKADLILFTHNHSDHFVSTAIQGLTNTGARICATPGIYASFAAALRSMTVGLTNGGATNLFGIGIEAIPAYNLANTPHTKGTNNNGYILTIGGKRIYISGDTEDIPEMRALQNIDVAFLPMNVPYTMTISQAVSAVTAFRPKVVYPDHYKNADNSFADVTSFKAQIGTGLGVEVRLRKWY
jgi:L-ascorbate metabolism protein UlaG (beta-lactamase superfamily)